jgi:hypothetical protein
MWGYGAPDWGTIPAHLQRFWNESASRSVCVRNFGQLGWNSTQSVIALLKELQQCRVPDLVIFHDGVNDISDAQTFGIPGVHGYMNEVALRMDTDVEPEPTGIRNLSVVRLATRLTTPPSQRPYRFPPRSYDVAPDLPERIVEVYLNNLRVVRALGREYGFAHAFFWQPHVSLGGKPLTDWEARFAARAADYSARDSLSLDDVSSALYSRTYEAVRQAARERSDLHYLADAFDTVRTPAYVDSHHLTPEANGIVAQRMFAAVGGAASLTRRPGGGSRSCGGSADSVANGAMLR